MPRAHLGCRYCVGTSFFKMRRSVCDKNKIREVIAVTIFALDYAVLLIAFLIVAYNVLKAPDDDNRNGGRRAMKMPGKEGFFKEMISRISARHHASNM